MDQIWVIGFAATFFGVSIGGIIVYFINGYKRSLGTIYAVCTGLILGLMSFSIVPEALQIGSWLILAVGFLVGTILFKLIHRALPLKLEKRPEIKTALFLTIIISFHNFPIGAILGASEQTDLGQSLLQTLILHNIPEGMILFTFIFINGFRLLPFVLTSLIVALPVAMGAIAGELIGMQTPEILSFIMSVTVGTIYMVTMKEVLPESVKYATNRYSMFVATIAFFLIGIYLLYL